MLDKFLLEVGQEREKQAADLRSRRDLGMHEMSNDELLKLASVTAPTPPGPPKVDGSSGATPEDIGAAVGAALKVVKDREAEQAAMAEEEAAAQEEEAQAQQGLEDQAAQANQPDPNMPPTFPPGQEPRQPPQMDPAAAGGAPPAADPSAGGAAGGGEVKQAFVKAAGLMANLRAKEAFAQALEDEQRLPFDGAEKQAGLHPAAVEGLAGAGVGATLGALSAARKPKEERGKAMRRRALGGAAAGGALGLGAGHALRSRQSRLMSASADKSERAFSLSNKVRHKARPDGVVDGAMDNWVRSGDTGALHGALNRNKIRSQRLSDASDRYQAQAVEHHARSGRAFGRAKRASIENAFTGAGAAAGLGTTALLQRRAAHHDSMMRDTGQMDRKTHWKRKAKRLGGLAVGTGVGAGVGRGALEFGREVDPHIKDYAKSWGPTIDETVKPVHDRITSTGGSLAAGFVPTEFLKKKVREVLRNKEAEPLSMNTLSMIGGGTVGLAGSALAQRKGRYHDQLMRDTGHMDAGTHRARKNRRTLGLVAGTAAGAGLGRGALEVGRSLDHHTKNYVKDWGKAVADDIVDPTMSRVEDVGGNMAADAAAKTTGKAVDAVKSVPARLAEAWKNRRTKKAYIEDADYDSDFLMDERVPLDVRREHYMKALKGTLDHAPLTRSRAVAGARTGDRFLGGTLGAMPGMFAGRVIGDHFGHGGLGATAGTLLGVAGGAALGDRAGRKSRSTRADKRVAYDTSERNRVKSLLGDPARADAHMHRTISTHRREKAERERAEAIRQEIRKHEQRKEMVNAFGEIINPKPRPASPQPAPFVSSPAAPKSERDQNLSKAEDLFKSKPKSAPRHDPNGSYSHWAKSKRPAGGRTSSTSHAPKPKYPTSHAGQKTTQKEWEDADAEINAALSARGLKHAFVAAAYRAMEPTANL